ncbi:MAG: NAD-dependent malic enzyme [Planctomycetes bacterium]|nr:NAD-dependent malic enzyme [Planctomycetota bacterium]
MSIPTGTRLLQDPRFNKGTAFTTAERHALGLRGLVPPGILDIQAQQARMLATLQRQANDLERYVHLISLQDRNETLFYRLVIDHIEQMMPLIYTPTVGQACQRHGHIYRRSRGLYISLQDLGHVRECIANWHNDDVRVIVVTDGERILGLGDLGVGGMGIPIGKLSLYTACAGVHPQACLPVTIDVGTDNAELLADPFYLGLRQKRERGPDYDRLIEEFIAAVQERWPGCLVQFEDFANQNAFRLLDRWRGRICCFNDDIQGTASVTLAGLLSALRVTGGTLADQRILFLGAGEAGIGTGDLVTASLMAEGMSEAEARTRCWFVDSQGLIVQGRERLTEHKKHYAHAHPPVKELLSAVQTLRPTALVGVSGQARSFTQPILAEMARINPRPIVFALSNPTSKAECTAAEAYAATGGRAVFASGSPFAPVEFGDHVLSPGQCNNAYIFPGIGLGVVASRARRVDDEMFIIAARTLARQVAQSDLDCGRIFPALSRIRQVSREIAIAIAAHAFDRGLAGIDRPADLGALIDAEVYDPSYRPLVAQAAAAR